MMVRVKDKKFSVNIFEYFQKFKGGLFSSRNLNTKGIFAPGGHFVSPKVHFDSLDPCEVDFNIHDSY